MVKKNTLSRVMLLMMALVLVMSAQSSVFATDAAVAAPVSEASITDGAASPAATTAEPPEKAPEKTPEKAPVDGTIPDSVISATDPGIPKSETVSWFLNSEDMKMTMPKNAQSFWFLVPEGVALTGDLTLQLHITYSTTLIDRLSALTVSVNDVPIATRNIVEEGKHSFIWELYVSQDMIRKDGFNEISLTSQQRSIEGECADIDNPSNWVIVHKESKMIANINHSVAPALKEFYNLFYDTFSKKTTIKTDYVLSAPMDARLVSTMMNISNATGMNFADRRYVEYLVGSQNAFKNTNNNKIFLGLRGDKTEWDGALLEMEGINEVPKDGAYLSMKGATQQTPYYKMLVYAEDKAGLDKASAYMGNRALIGQTDQPRLLLYSDVKPVNQKVAAKKNDGGVYRFSEFGFSDASLAGVFHQRMDYTFVQPEGVRGSEGSYIEIHFRHSEALLSERSQLTASINGTPVSSVKLTPSNAAEGTLTVEIPEKALQDPEITLTVECYHYLGKVDCTKDYNDVAWTVIDAEKSKISLIDSGEALRPTLKGFPYFNDKKETAEISMFMPDDWNSPLLESAAMLATRTGQNTGMTFSWDVVKENLKSDTEGNVIVLGRKDNISLPKEVAEELPILPTSDGYIIQDETLSVIPETLDRKVILQVIRSPYDFFKKIYVITYDANDNLSILKDLFNDRTKMAELTGQVCIVGNKATINSFEIEAYAGGDKVPKTFTDYVKQVEAFTGMPWWMMACLLIIVIAIIMFIIKMTRRKHDEYQYAGEKHKEEQGFIVEPEAQQQTSQPTQDAENEMMQEMSESSEQTSSDQQDK